MANRELNLKSQALIIDIQGILEMAGGDPPSRFAAPA